MHVRPQGGGKSRRWPSPRKIPKQFFYMWGAFSLLIRGLFSTTGCLFSPYVGLFHHVKVFLPIGGIFWGLPPLQTFLQAPMLECMTIEIEISFYSE